MKHTILFVLATAFFALQPQMLWAHCDTYDGPVIKAAEEALDQGNVNLVLVWVPEKAEAQITKAFEVARQSPDARVKFFEELVRVHREGEGERYTGLKPAGTPVAPEIAAADQAIANGKIDPVLKYVPAGHRAHVNHAFARVLKTRGYEVNDVRAGRRYVAAYVEFVHLVEGHHH